MIELLLQLSGFAWQGDVLASGFFHDLVKTLEAFEYVHSFSDFLLWIELMPTAVRWLMFGGMFGLTVLAYAFIRATLPYAD